VISLCTGDLLCGETDPSSDTVASVEAVETGDTGGEVASADPLRTWLNEAEVPAEELEE
jgi:hypothetical protein